MNRRRSLKKGISKVHWDMQERSTREQHFLRMAARAVPEMKSDARELWLEARALHLIFAKIWRSGKEK